MTSDANSSRPTFLRLRQVLSRTGLSRSTLYAYVREGRFPAPVSISERCVAWVEAEIDRWISDRIATRRQS
jgi:prophage regulatory protein